jgi:hypothetical protein
VRKGGTLGAPLPVSAKGHCGFVSSWSAPGQTCHAPASEHYLVRDGGDVCTMFVCPAHAPRAADLFEPLDRHPVDGACLHRDAVWQTSAPNRPGFCFVPEEDAELLAGLERELTDSRQ